MVKAVIFDLDGLLINSEVVAFKAVNAIAAEYGKKIDMDDYTVNFLGRTVLKSMEYIVEKFNLTVSAEYLYEKYKVIEDANTSAGIPLKPYGKEILEFLKENRVKMIIASGSSRDRAKTLLEKNNVLDLFDDMIFSYEVPRGKPYPDIFLAACEKIGVEPDEAVVLEDSEAGIDASYSANIPVICIPDLKYPDEEHANKCLKVFPSLYEVIELFKSE